MSDPITTAIYTRLADDATLTTLLASDGIGGPAIYDSIPVPAAAQMPYVIVPAPISDVWRDAFDAEYRDLIIDIHAYASRPDSGGGDRGAIDSIAYRIRSLLHRDPVQPVGYRGMDARVSGPRTWDDDTAFGRILTLELRLGITG